MDKEKIQEKKRCPIFYRMIVFFGVIGMGLTLLFHISKNIDKNITEPIVVEQYITPLIIKQYSNEAAYTNWILKHSSKISKDTATNIFRTAMSYKYGLLLLALAEAESSFNPAAVSKKGAIGLNQVMPNIWVKELQKNKIIKEKRDLFNYETNLKASNYILLKYYGKTGSWKEALNKYVGANSESYVKKVLSNCGELYLLNITYKEKNNETVKH